MADVILSKPLNIAAPDLMRAVFPSHSGTLYIKSKNRLGKKKWRSRYVVISQGCLYIYEDKNAKETKNAYCLTHFESVKELDTTDDEESFCFCLKYAVPTKKPLVFACDTDATREDWVEELNEVLKKIQDSGFESGGSVSSRKKKIYTSRSDSQFTRSGSGFLSQELLDDQGIKGYDEISSVFADTEMPAPVQESLRHQQAMSRTCRNISTNSIDQLKNLTIQAPAEPSQDLYINTRSLSNVCRSEQALASAQFLSVRGPNSTSAVSNMVDESVCIQDTKNCEEDADSEGTGSSGNTSPKTIYENPGIDDNKIYENTKMYEEIEYFCDSKKSLKSNLRGKPSGTFLICPGDTVRWTLCIKVPNGDTAFYRIHEKDGKLSLHEDCTIEKYMFPTLDTLLRYYHIYELPSKKFKVTLKKGLSDESVEYRKKTVSVRLRQMIANSLAAQKQTLKFVLEEICTVDFDVMSSHRLCIETGRWNQPVGTRS